VGLVAVMKVSRPKDLCREPCLLALTSAQPTQQPQGVERQRAWTSV